MESFYIVASWAAWIVGEDNIERLSVVSSELNKSGTIKSKVSKINLVNYLGQQPNMSDESSQGVEVISAITHTLGDIAGGISSITLPPMVKKSVLKALGTLITTAVDVPAAWLESKSQAIRDQTTGRSLFASEAAKAAARKFASDEQLIERAVDHFGARIIKEQRNREVIAQAVVKELGSAPPTEDTNQEIDEDWLDMFSRIAEKRSNQDMQRYLAKLLAGEIRKPGSFAPSTVEVLSKLTPDLARIFQNFCNISIVEYHTVDGYLADEYPFVLVEPFGEPGQNALADLGFTYHVITQLQDAGLVQYDLSAWREFSALSFTLPIEIGGTILSFATSEQFSQEAIQNRRRLKVINFTTAGVQVRRIVDKTPNKQYVQKVKEWVISSYGL